MTVETFANSTGCKILCMPSPEREIDGAYIGDLLSWVMGKAQSGNVWITIMSNLNVVAVATLADPACIILSEGVEPEAGVTNKAQSVGVNVLSSKKDTFALCAEVAALL